MDVSLSYCGKNGRQGQRRLPLTFLRRTWRSDMHLRPRRKGPSIFLECRPALQRWRSRKKMFKPGHRKIIRKKGWQKFIQFLNTSRYYSLPKNEQVERWLRWDYPWLEERWVWKRVMWRRVQYLRNLLYPFSFFFRFWLYRRSCR